MNHSPPRVDIFGFNLLPKKPPVVMPATSHSPTNRLGSAAQLPATMISEERVPAPVNILARNVRIPDWWSNAASKRGTVNLYSSASSRERSGAPNSRDVSLRRQREQEEKEVEELGEGPYTRTKVFENRKKEMRPTDLPDEAMVDILVK